MLTKEKVKQLAKECGADIVGVASLDRYAGAPKQWDPRYIKPDAKSMIVMGFRILRGALRGIEEGTLFKVYSVMGYASINHIYQPMTLWNFCKALEDEGYEAVPLTNNHCWEAVKYHAIDWKTEQNIKGDDLRAGFSRPVEPGKPAPDVVVHMRIAAFLAGLGEIGYSKVFLTPEFGPLQRLAAVLTDLELEPDPIMKPGTLCDRCLSCARQCIGGAISTDKTVKVTLAGHQVEWGELDAVKCKRNAFSPAPEHNPFITSPEDKEKFRNLPLWESVNYKLGPDFGYGRSIDGGSGCLRACLAHLEAQGKLTHKFQKPFRTKKPWKLDDPWADDPSGQGTLVDPDAAPRPADSCCG